MRKRKLFTGVLLVMTAVGALWVHANLANAAGRESTREATSQDVRTMRIRMILKGTTIMATLVDSETARDLASLLPLTLTLRDYASTEKVSDLPRKLSTKGAPHGSDPEIADITYYSPWGNLAIFYKDFSYASGLVILGKVESGIEALATPGPMTVTIELAEDLK